MRDPASGGGPADAAVRSGQYGEPASAGAGVRVLVPGPLRSYTNAPEVRADGASLAEVMADLERRHPGMRFRMIDEHDRIRPHIKLFVDRVQQRSLGAAVAPGAEVMIVCALSGG